MQPAVDMPVAEIDLRPAWIDMQYFVKRRIALKPCSLYAHVVSGGLLALAAVAQAVHIAAVPVPAAAALIAQLVGLELPALFLPDVAQAPRLEVAAFYWQCSHPADHPQWMRL
jgi:hypothetical protein